jgi:hypothetical protein
VSLVFRLGWLWLGKKEMAELKENTIKEHFGISNC